MSDAPADTGPVDLGAASQEEPEAEETRRPRSRTRTMVLAALLAATLAGGTMLAYAGWQIFTQKDAKLTTPPQIGTLKLDNTPDGQSTADYLQTALAAEINLDKTVGAVYLDGTDKNVLFLGGTGLIWSPESTLDTAFGLISDKEGAVTGLHDISPGKLAGTMKCGTTKSDTGALAVCGWSDHGTVALAMFPNRPESEAAPLLRQIREATESR